MYASSGERQELARAVAWGAAGVEAQMGWSDHPSKAVAIRTVTASRSPESSD